MNIFDGAIQTFDFLFRKYGVKAKFFVVGRDLLKNENAEVIKKISTFHEIGNHTFSHYSDFGKLDLVTIKRDIVEAHTIIKSVIPTNIKYYKAPGYSFRSDIHETLANELNYTNDYSPINKTSISALNVYAKIKKMKKIYTSPEFPKMKKKYLINVTKHTEIKFINLLANSTIILGLNLENNLNFTVKNLGGNNSFVFHAIDLLKTDLEFKQIPILRIPFRERLIKIEKIIKQLAAIKNE